MKRLTFLVVYLCLFAGAGNCVLAQTFQRTAKRPSFFIPQNVNTSQTEKLPPVSSINYHGKNSASTVTATEENTASTLQNSQIAKEKIVEKSADIAPQTAQYKQQQTKDIATRKPQPRQEKNTHDTIAVITPQPAENKTPPQPLTDNTKNITTFAQALEDYRNDLEKIRQNGKAENPRLAKIIASYSDLEHPVE